MLARIRPHMSYANVTATLALFLALSGGIAWALGANSVKSKHIAPNAAKGLDIAEATLAQVPDADQLDGMNSTDFAAAQAAVPAGAVSFFNLANCPSGWSELTTARGRYLVGMPSGGTLAGTAGSALTDQENRVVGQHSHGLSTDSHNHDYAAGWAYNDAADGGSVRRPLFDFKPADASVPDVSALQSASGTHSVLSAGAVTGTNAPYLQLLSCEKN